MSAQRGHAARVEPPSARQGYTRAFWLICLLVLLPGCSNRLLPPELLKEPVTIHLIDHGRHPSLVLPGRECGWVRYAHGEWRWYAQRQQGVWRGLQSLFWPTRATLGRQQLESLPRHPGVSAAIPEGYRERYSFQVEKAHVSALREQLDAHFEESADWLFQPDFNLQFVPIQGFYWFGNNSNRTMVAWLRTLDVRVTGNGLFSQWQLNSQEDTGFDQHGTGRTDVVSRHGRGHGGGGDQLCAAE